MIERTSADWPAAKRWLLAEIENCRVEMESAECGIKRADHLRGMIMGYRRIVATVEPTPIETAESVLYT